MAIEIPLSFSPEDTACALAVAPGYFSGISLAKAGDMAMSRRHEIPDRARFLGSLGMPPEGVVGIHQVHSRTVTIVDGQQPVSLASTEADGLITLRSDVLLTITVADCLPIFLVDQTSGAFGIVHSGWKGTGIVLDALDAMGRAFGTRPGDVVSVLGPGIGQCCYTVPKERYERFRIEYGDHAVARGVQGEYRLDLRAANVRLMESVGVQRISVISDCTCCSPALGSFRREGQGFRRMLAFIGRGHIPYRRPEGLKGESS